MSVLTVADHLKRQTATGRVLRTLQITGSISTREAMIDLAVGHPAREICRLRNEFGFKIETVKKNNPTTNQRYARWVLVEQEAA